MSDEFDEKISANKLKAIFSKTVRKGDCLEWTGSYYQRPNGKRTYPQLYMKSRHWRGNRLVWMLAKGKIPKGMLVLHSCDNMKCLNIKHLSLGTYTDNNRQMVARGRHREIRKTHCPKGHKYSGENLRVDPQGNRHCRSCQWYINRKMKPRKKLKYAE